MNAAEVLEEHTREMVSAGMGYALAKLAEDPGWLMRMPRNGSLGDAVAPDVDSFMEYRGRFAVGSLLDDLDLS